MDKNRQSLGKRIVYFDYLRIIAVFAVIMIHVSTYKWRFVDVNTIEWFFFNLFDSVSRFGVPIFVMISGALFLKKDVKISKIYSKYIPRMLIAFIAWSFAYYLFRGESVFSQLSALFQSGVTQRLAEIIRGNFHLWFILMISGLYICSPILRQIVKDKKILKYFLIISFIFWILLPQLFSSIGHFGGARLKILAEAFNKDISYMRMNLVMSYAFYFVLGYYLSNTTFNKKQKRIIYILGVLSFIFTIVISWAVSIKYQKIVETYYDNPTINVMLQSIFIFELFKNLSFKNKRINNLAVSMSKWSFGVYLVHMLILNRLEIFGLNALSFPSYFSVPAITIIVFILSFVASAVLNHIPILKKTV